MEDDREVLRRQARDEILRRCYDLIDQDGDVYSRDVADAVGIPYAELHTHVLAEMGSQGLLGPGSFGNPRGSALRLSAAGVAEAEDVGVVDREKVERHWAVRLELLRRLASLRKDKGPHGMADLRQLCPEGVSLRVADWALRYLEHKGLVEPHPHGAGLRIISEIGLDALERLDRQSALSAKLSEIEALSPQRRGKALEGVLADALRAQGCRCEEDQGGKGEQIDLVAESGLGFFVCECKWEKKPIQGGVVDQMVSRMGRRPAFFVGVIFSMSGFTPNAYEIATRALGNRTVLLVGEKETRGIIQGERSFEEIATEQLRQIAARGRLEPANT